VSSNEDRVSHEGEKRSHEPAEDFTVKVTTLMSSKRTTGHTTKKAVTMLGLVGIARRKVPATASRGFAG
jgi:hypothetical protein